MAEVVGGAFLGYAVTETLNRVLRTLKKIVAFPVECQKLRCRLLIIKPTVEQKEALLSVEEREALSIAIQTSAPAQDTAAPGSDHIEGLEHGMGRVTGYSALTAPVEWLKQVKGLLDEAEKVLEECDTVKIGRIREPVKKHNLAGKLSKLKDRFNSVMSDGLLAVLVEVDGMVTDLMGTVNEMSKKMDESLEDTSEIRRMHDEYPILLQETNKKIDEQLPPLQNLQGRSGAAAIPVEDPLASTLKALSVRTGRDKRCKVKLDICELTDIPPNRFRAPREIKPYVPHLSLKLLRSKNASADACDPVSLYIIAVNPCLTPGRKPSEAITIEDIENGLNKMLAADPASDNVIVKHFQFDIKHVRVCK